MRAARLLEIHRPLVIEERSSLSPGQGQSLVHLRTAALNRRDFWMQHGLYPGMHLPVTPGSDGAGLCDGREVVINPGLGWGEDELVQGKEFRILGMPENGTLADEIVVPSENVFPRPAHLSWEESAALPLAGVTAYRALFTQGNVLPGEKILITGIGGGVALMAAQMAVANGMTVCVTSGTRGKLQRAEALGVHGTANYHEPGWLQQLTGKYGNFDIVVDSAAGESFGELLKAVKPGGRIVMYGGTLGKIRELSPHILFWRQITIRGSTMGSPGDFEKMLAFVQEHRIRPIVDTVLSLDEVNAGLAILREGSQFGKVVIRLTT